MKRPDVQKLLASAGAPGASRIQSMLSAFREVCKQMDADKLTANSTTIDRFPPTPCKRQNRINIYTCQECGGQLVTEDVHDGVTPFMKGCERPGCNGMGQSSFYRVPQDLVATHEWYSPEVADRFSITDRATLDHVLMGGLLLRKKK